MTARTSTAASVVGLAFALGVTGFGLFSLLGLAERIILPWYVDWLAAVALRYAGGRSRVFRYSATTSSVSSSSEVSAVGLSNVMAPCWSRFTRSQTLSTCA